MRNKKTEFFISFSINPLPFWRFFKDFESLFVKGRPHSRVKKYGILAIVEIFLYLCSPISMKNEEGKSHN